MYHGLSAYNRFMGLDFELIERAKIAQSVDAWLDEVGPEDKYVSFVDKEGKNRYEEYVKASSKAYFNKGIRSYCEIFATSEADAVWVKKTAKNSDKRRARLLAKKLSLFLMEV